VRGLAGGEPRRPHSTSQQDDFSGGLQQVTFACGFFPVCRPGSGPLMLLRPVLVVLLLAQAGCAAQKALPQRHVVADFSGSWEMNYARSERAAGIMEALYTAQQREAQKHARRPYRNREPAIAIGGPGGGSLASLVPLARFAEYITTSTIVEISQTDKDIQISRNQDFTLGCDFLQKTIDREANPLGSEVCGWDGRDLVLRLALPDKLDVLHRLTISPDGNELRIATTVSSGGQSRSFTINKFFYRFDSPPENFQCQFTLTRGNVCSRRTP
jgi:hypothetical protein